MEELLEVPAHQWHKKTAVTICLLAMFFLIGGGFYYTTSGHPSQGDPPAKDYPSALSGMDENSDPSAAVDPSATVNPSAMAAESAAFANQTAPPEYTDPPAASPVELPWSLILVNKSHPLPDDFSVPSRTTLPNGHAIDSRAYPYLEQMLSDARAAGGHPYILSSFRTLATQKRLFQNRIQRFQNDGYSRAAAEELAGHWVAVPNTSEHQLGLALDIVDENFQSLTSRQASTVTQQWLMAHCAEYGFVLRYPSSKIEITGIGYEPWHYRYVGVEAAKEMTERGLCLEEYIALLTGTD